MVFNSLQFILFLPLVALVYYVVPNRFKNIWLVVTSYYFYACWNAKYLVLLAACTLVTYFGGIFLGKYRSKEESGTDGKGKCIVTITILINLSILLYYKYLDFALFLVRQTAKVVKIEVQTPSFDIVLPVGISFFIFQGIGYLVDVYRKDKESEKNFIDFALFISFFPQLLSGPISRSTKLIPQLKTPKTFKISNLKQGFVMMLWGFFLKLVIADRCSLLVDTVYSNYMDYAGEHFIFANFIFAVQIYCDFMGYSTIAVGCAKILGIELTENFRQPYFATSIKKFWSRWHISLSTWLRDYVYIPLGGNRGSKVKKYRNIILTFLTSGLWHGASPSFVIWGLLHAFYQIIEDLLRPVANKVTNKLNVKTNSFGWKAVCAIKTFILVDIAWIFFKANSLPKAFFIIRNLFRFNDVGLFFNNGIFQLGLDRFSMTLLFIGLIVLFVISLLKEKGTDIYFWIFRQKYAVRYAFYLVIILVLILSMDVGGKEFIYFQF